MAAGALRPRSAGRAGLRAVAGWLVLLAAIAAWELLAYVQAPRSEHPTLSSLTNDALDSHLARAGAFVAWLAGGAWLARP
jgi:hypothetical protein